MACPPDDREGAVREVAKVYELIKTHQPLLHHHHQGQPATTQLAQSLLSEALRALNIALSTMTMMQQQQQRDSSRTTASPLALTPEPQLLSSPSPASEPADSEGATTGTSARTGKRRRPAIEGGKNSSWVNLTKVPHEDGYEWRKYGEKRINGTHFTRSYFRCTYKDDKGCLATKYVQQKDNNSDPPVFQVTYNNDHTCNCTTTSSPAKKNNILPTGGAASNNPPIGGHHDVVIKQEATVVLPPLADVSAVPLDNQMPCQEPFPTGDHYVTADAGIPSATTSSPGDGRSCIFGMSCDELDMGRIMTESLIMGDDPEFQDLELPLMYYSFKYP